MVVPVEVLAALPMQVPVVLVVALGLRVPTVPPCTYRDKTPRAEVLAVVVALRIQVEAAAVGFFLVLAELVLMMARQSLAVLEDLLVQMAAQTAARTALVAVVDGGHLAAQEVAV